MDQWKLTTKRGEQVVPLELKKGLRNYTVSWGGKGVQAYAKSLKILTVRYTTRSREEEITV